MSGPTGAAPGPAGSPTSPWTRRSARGRQPLETLLSSAQGPVPGTVPAPGPRGPPRLPGGDGQGGEQAAGGPEGDTPLCAGSQGPEDTCQPRVGQVTMLERMVESHLGLSKCGDT